MQAPLKNYVVTSRFGWRNLNGVQQYHCGLDLISYIDRNVYSPLPGTVIFAGNAGTAGNMVMIKSPQGQYEHRFMHLDSVKVKVGQTVEIGDVIGVFGNTGYSFGAHLHWDVKQVSTNQFIDPLALIK